LLTDAEPCAVATSYDSYGLKKMMGREYMGMMRHTFVIDAEGKIEKIYTKVKSETMADDVLKDLGLA
jgi:peroxiredoxin Q/BCP